MHRSNRARAAAAVLAISAIAGAAPTAASAAGGFDLEAHRGGRGLRPENTLASFGKALQLGVTTLELDTGVTKDGIVVVSHERRISALECGGDPTNKYIGKLIHELTYAQLKTLDCGQRGTSDSIKATQEQVPGTRMPKLSQVFALADRYGAKDVQFNIETKIDPTAPAETVGPDTFARKVIAEIRKARVTKRALLQSFDWRTLKVARSVAPSLRTVALAQPGNVFPGSKWTAGYRIASSKPFDDGSVALVVARDLKADAISPVATSTTARLIKSSHNVGLPVIPWTVNEKADMVKLIDAGVDGLISDYPDRLREVLAAKGIETPDPIASPFDVEAHRGGRGVRPENTLASFSYALDKHVDTLELDTGVTRDGVLVVSHDSYINTNHCAGPGLPPAPAHGPLIKDLTLAEVKQYDCGLKDPQFAATQVASGVQRMPTLQEVIDLVRSRGDDHVRLNIETKLSPTNDDTVPYDQFTAKLVKAIQDNDLQDRADIQSFDWRTIILSKKLDPSIETVGLVWQYAGADCDDVSDECSLEAVVGDPSVISPWTGGLDWWAYKDLGKLARAARADVVSANWQVHDPTQTHVDSPDEYLRTDPAIYHGPTVPELQNRGLRVVPYTVNDEPTIQRVIGLGVDGIISDYPERVQLLAKRNGLE